MKIKDGEKICLLCGAEKTVNIMSEFINCLQENKTHLLFENPGCDKWFPNEATEELMRKEGRLNE